MLEYPCPGFGLGWVGLRVHTDGASASGLLRQLIFRVRVLVAVKDLPQGATVRRAEGQEGYECGVGNILQRCYLITKLIYFGVLRGLLYNAADYRAGKNTARTTRGCICHDTLVHVCRCV